MRLYTYLNETVSIKNFFFSLYNINKRRNGKVKKKETVNFKRREYYLLIKIYLSNWTIHKKIKINI